MRKRPSQRTLTARLTATPAIAHDEGMEKKRKKIASFDDLADFVEEKNEALARLINTNVVAKMATRELQELHFTVLKDDIKKVDDKAFDGEAD